MFLVAVAGLARTVEEEAPLLAADLGATTYEVGLVLRGASPAVVLRTEDRARATEILTRLRTRGHDAIACDSSAITASKEMLSVRSFRFEPDALSVNGEDNTNDRTAYSDLLALVRATHATDQATVEKTETTKFSLGRAAMTGGLMPTKRVASERTVRSSEREQVLYVFRRSGRPWIVRASRVKYDGLGATIRPTQLENWGVFGSTLRQNAPSVPYDERFVAQAKKPEEIDVLAHLVGLALTRERPWRG